MTYGKFRRIAAKFGAVLALLGPLPGHAQKVRIFGLSDVAYGTIANLGTDQVKTQDVCAHSTSPTNGYSVLAQGNGTAFAFTLASGSNKLAYEVQWAASTGQTTGTNLVANVLQTGFTGRGNTNNCNAGQATASLITILRSTALSAAKAGTYSGTLTLLLAPI